MDTTLIGILAALMMALGAGFIYFILRENARPLPQGGLQWAATGLSSLLIISSGFLFILAVVPAELPPGADPQPSEMNRPAPGFAFRTVVEDTPQQLSDYAGKVVLLNFWATWCAPCITEMPELNRLQQNYRDDGLVVLTISDEPRPELLAFEEIVPYQTLAGYVPSPEALPDPFRRTLAMRPTTYVIDRDGYLRRFIKGAGTYAFFEQLVRPYL